MRSRTHEPRTTVLGIAGGAVAGLLGFFLAIPEARGEELTAEERRIVASAEKRAAAALPLIERAVNIKSGTLNIAGVKEVGALFRAEFDRIGFQTRWAAMPEGMHRAGHLIAEHAGTRGKRLLLIGHLDTVLEGKPFKRNGSRAEGSGTIDMKGGDVVAIAALQALEECGALADRQVVVVFTGDEEAAGSPISTSRADLIAAARRSDVALAFEAAIDGTATVARRGVASWRLSVSAPGGHSSGVFKEGGAGAIYEASRILDAFRLELGGEKNLSINPSLFLGGTDVVHDGEADRGTAEGKTNVVAKTTIVGGDYRFISPEQKAKAETGMIEIVARHLPKTMGKITFSDEYPAMAPKPANYEVLELLDKASKDLGFGPVKALDPAERGAGDVSFVAAMVAGLDGLGLDGKNSHRPDEYIELDSIPIQIKRAALLMYRLTR